MKYLEKVNVQVIGHVRITDETGKVHLDKYNKIHPQNMARIIARSLAREGNDYIYKLAFGNGGTVTDTAGAITLFPPNDGFDGTVWNSTRWQDTLYNQTYYEIVDEDDIQVGEGPGASPIDDIVTPNVVSEELGLQSRVVVTVTLNKNEPSGQSIINQTDNMEADFVFDEVGLFTSGAPATNTAGYQDVNVSDKTLFDDTGLAPSTMYDFSIDVDGGGPQAISIVTGVSSPVTYDDLITLINAQIVGATSSISDGATVQTYGKLRFTSDTVGASSTVSLSDVNLFSSIVGFSSIEGAVPGANQGLQNDPNSANERERLLSHVIFTPIQKAANVTMTITYSLIVNVQQNT